MADTAAPGRPRGRRRRRGVLAAGLLLVGLLAAGAVVVVRAQGVPEKTSPGPAAPAWPSGAAVAGATGNARTLVLYDTGGAYGHLGEVYAIQVANLVSHFGSWSAHPVRDYTAGEYAGYTAIVYIGSTYDEPLPAPFLADVAAARVPVLWLNNNIWQLTTQYPDAGERYGFLPQDFDPAPVTEIRYKGVALTRDRHNEAGIMRLEVTDPAKARPVAEAVRADGTTFPWGVRSGTLTYLGELPLTYTGSDDRYLAFADLLFADLAPGIAERHRALVRLEDVGPHSDPTKLRQIADYLHGRRVPFSIGVIAEYNDPAGTYNNGVPVLRRLSQEPELVAALHYAVERGATLIMHGFTHGYAGGANPYGVSAEDFEFYRAHVDATNTVVLDGPVPEDSTEWALGRVKAARAEWAAAGLPAPKIFEFPHYAASATDYRAISKEFGIRYERAMYFSGVLTGNGLVDDTRWASQFFPYPVRDVYGASVIPETLGNVATQEFNQHGIRTAADILASARRQLVVRDGVASFFYHPFLGLAHLPALVEGIQALGYTFVAAEATLGA